MKKCTSCQGENSDTAKFCDICGEKLEVQDSVPVSAVPEQVSSTGVSETSVVNQTSNPPEQAQEKPKGSLQGFVSFVLLVALVFAYFMGQQNAVMNTVKEGNLPSAGINMTLEAFFNKNLANAKWSDEKISSGTYHVYVSGYSSEWESNLKFTFYCEELSNDMVNYQLASVSSLDNGAVFTTVLEITTILDKIGASVS